MAPMPLSETDPSLNPSVALLPKATASDVADSDWRRSLETRMCGEWPDAASFPEWQRAGAEAGAGAEALWQQVEAQAAEIVLLQQELAGVVAWSGEQLAQRDTEIARLKLDVDVSKRALEVAASQCVSPAPLATAGTSPSAERAQQDPVIAQLRQELATTTDFLSGELDRLRQELAASNARARAAAAELAASRFGLEAPCENANNRDPPSDDGDADMNMLRAELAACRVIVGERDAELACLERELPIAMQGSPDLRASRILRERDEEIICLKRELAAIVETFSSRLSDEDISRLQHALDAIGEAFARQLAELCELDTGHARPQDASGLGSGPRLEEPGDLEECDAEIARVRRELAAASSALECRAAQDAGRLRAQEGEFTRLRRELADATAAAAERGASEGSRLEAAVAESARLEAVLTAAQVALTQATRSRDEPVVLSLAELSTRPLDGTLDRTHAVAAELWARGVGLLPPAEGPRVPSSPSAHECARLCRSPSAASTATLAPDTPLAPPSPPMNSSRSLLASTAIPAPNRPALAAGASLRGSSPPPRPRRGRGGEQGRS